MQNYLENFIDQLFPQLSDNTPGCVLAVIHKGKFAFQKSYGLANLGEHVAITADTVFDVGSVAKQFTAACIALLVERKELDLEDDIRAFFSDMPDYSYPILLKHLLHHTSGLKDYQELAYLKGLDEHTYYDTAYATRLLFNQPDLNFVPGDEERYSNSNYMLLGQVVEFVSGLSLREFADQHIFEPLGMLDTHFHDRFAEIVPRFAVGYVPDGAGDYEEFTSKIDVVGDGGLYTTLNDLLRWDQNFYANQLGNQSPALLQLMTTPGRLNDDIAFDYGFGLILGTYEDKPVQRHGGVFAGYCSEMIRFPQEQLTVVCLANLATIAPWTVAEEVADLFFGNASEVIGQASTAPAPGDFEPVQNVNEVSMEEFVGGYDLGAATPLEVIQEEGNLMLKYGAEDILTLFAKSETVFFEPEYSILVQFRKSAGAGVPFMVFKTPDQEIIAAKVPVKKMVDTQALKIYEGDYYCEALRMVYRLFVDEKGLQVSIDFNPPVLLHLTETDFAEGSLGSIQFFRKEDSSIREFNLNSGRADYLRFVRL